ncbi:MAG: response regulator transcription factor [Spirochaetia bacterium]|nr:response regulator transcription factor [Spirochaetia bacterium]
MEILVVDDEMPIVELIKYNLQKEGFSVITADNGATALRYAREKNPDLIILDLMLPDMSGYEICKTIKDNPTTTDIPIIFVTAKDDDKDIVKGLELGAEDYVTKPFSPRVLLARVNRALKRLHDLPPKEDSGSEKLVIQSHDLKIDKEKFEVFYCGKPIIFSATEFAIIYHLAKNPGKVFPRKQIINDIKGKSYPATERSIDVQILSIRKKLTEINPSDGPNLIETVRGVGYRFIE